MKEKQFTDVNGKILFTYSIQDGKNTVGGSLDLEGTNITASTSIKRSHDDVEIQFNKKGYTIADGILAKIISSKKNYKKVIVVGEKEPSYLAFDGDGNYSHGKTLREAKDDLVYKANANFDGKIPDRATGKEWVAIYRAATGACSQCVKIFVEQTGKSLDETYSAKEIANLVAGHYGADKFLKLMEVS